MKRLSFIFVLAFVISNAIAQEKPITAFLNTTTFNVPEVSPFVENSIAFDPYSVTYTEFEKGKFKATVEITTIFKSNDTIRAFSKIALDSPVVTDTSLPKQAFMNQQRFTLHSGNYEMDINVTDINATEPKNFSTSQKLNIYYNDELPSMSDILLVDTYTKAATPSECTKSGYDFVPRISSFYPDNASSLLFYAELYNSTKLYADGKYILNYHISSAETLEEMKGLSFTQRIDVAPVNVVLKNIDISKLPSGNYYLVVEMRDRTNSIITSNSIFFQRSNTVLDYQLEEYRRLDDGEFANMPLNLDTVREYVRCLGPLMSDSERSYTKNLLRGDDSLAMRQFVYNFWLHRNPSDPQKAWNEYYAQVKRVNASFSTRRKKGYDTDRGYIYLKYGTPDKIVQEYNEPGAYPYEIWHYYEILNHHNKRFVFMSKDNATNEFSLIHSDMPGEIYNYRWQMEIYSRNYGEDYNNNIDQTENPDAFGTRAGDLYNNPR